MIDWELPSGLSVCVYVPTYVYILCTYESSSSARIIVLFNIYWRIMQLLMDG